MTPADLDAVVALQQRCYGVAYWESREAFAAKLAAAAGQACCWVAEQGAQLMAYAVSLPVASGEVPRLHAPTVNAAARPAQLYLHDLAVAPEARAHGLAGALLARVAQAAHAQGLSTLALVAVQGSVPYWRRHGFTPADPVPAAAADALMSFGSQACYLVRALEPPERATA
ncbi:GNAT family N-acetyltransferase [Roseateles sp. BYS87W]|uniref:GNAT family N-acetyltransferase n=1 Tax=Pelomonas baiyunensis TaxID=3299026 RepID=A0ABW7GWE9_9BURK